MGDTTTIEIELTEKVDDVILADLSDKGGSFSDTLRALLRWANEHRGKLIEDGVLDPNTDPNPL